MSWNGRGRTTERRVPWHKGKSSPFKSSGRSPASPPLFVGVRLCSSYTKEVVMGRRLSTRDDLIMSTTPTAPECQTLDISDAATALGVCKETVRRLVRRKVLRKLPGFRRILIPRTEIHRYLNEH
jgi:excisionase family DNA binding protein